MQERSDIEYALFWSARAESRAEVTRAASAAIARTTSRGSNHADTGRSAKANMVPYRVITPARAPSDNVNMEAKVDRHQVP